MAADVRAMTVESGQIGHLFAGLYICPSTTFERCCTSWWPKVREHQSARRPSLDSSHITAQKQSTVGEPAETETTLSDWGSSWSQVQIL